VLFYLAVAAGAVTHEDLFFEKSVKLPFLTGIQLPLVAFFFLAPILFIIVHAYTLVHLVFLTEKAKRYHQALYDRERNVTDAARQNLQWRLPSNIFIQFLAGPSSLRRGAFGWLLRAIAWVTLVIAPILLLLMMQIQFLPFHSSFIAWTQRIALVVDLVLIWWLWGRILSGREADGRRRGSWAWAGLGVAFSLAAILFSGAAATFPGEWQEDHLPEWRWRPALSEWWKPATEKDAAGKLRTASFQDWAVNAKKLSLHDWLFNENPDDVSRRRFPFSNTLVLTGRNIYEGLGIDDPEKAKWHDYVLRARGRDLRGAIFDFAILPKVDFTGADLQGARLFRAQLQGASLDNAQLQGASLQDAELQGAYARNAQFEAASLDGARLQRAKLQGAQLQGASLFQAQLMGASLGGAQLQGASLIEAQFQGASLDNAQLQGASLYSAYLRGASLFGAQLQGADLAYAQLQGASLQEASLLATDLIQALLWRTNAKSPVPEPAAVRLANSTGDWRPVWRNENGDVQPWNEKAYQDLRKAMDSIPAGGLRDEALEGIRRLECPSTNPTLVSCDPSAAPPTEAAAWRKALEAAGVSDDAYREALAGVLKSLVCSGGDDAIHVLRGAGLRSGLIPGFQIRLQAAGRAAIGLIDDLMNKGSKDCPVAAGLTDADRARLLQVKQRIEAAPIPESARAYTP
jgi:uncharacterized protein YjbI with pentapeptide repeats